MDTITKEKAADTFEVNETPVNSGSKLPTREEAKAEGLTADELDRAEKRGLVAKPEDVVKKAADDKAKAEAETKVEEVVQTDEKADLNRRAEDKTKTSLPDFTMTPEQEKVFLAAFPPGTPNNGLYFRMKNERQARQAAEQARDKERKSREELEARVKTLEAGKITPEVDELGNPIDPDEKPLTLKQLREIQKAEAEAIEKKNKENEERARTVAEAQQTQEEYGKSVYPDFDQTVDLVSDLIKNMDTLVPEQWKKTKIINKVRELQVAAAQADKIDLDEYHAAHIAYELGQMHPKYGKTAESDQNGSTSEKDGKSKDPKKANGGYTPEQMRRLEENTTRRASSASVTGGGGKRTISVDDVDAVALDKMTYSERQKFREKHPDRYAKLLRG